MFTVCLILDFSCLFHKAYFVSLAFSFAKICFFFLKTWGSESHDFCLRSRSALAVNCQVIINCLEVSLKEDQIKST